jgi:hypothetical protein
MLIPFFLYLGVTILVPILNGARVDGEFLEHALVVVAAAGLIALPFRGGRREAARRERARSG